MATKVTSGKRTPEKKPLPISRKKKVSDDD